MIIPVLHTEKQLQLRDLTRIFAGKSVLVKGSANPIVSVKIKAGADATEVDVYGSNPENWFLDWAFNSYAFDVDSSNSRIDFEMSGNGYTTNVLTGTYTLANLLEAIKNAMEAIAPSLTVSFTVDEKNRITMNPSSPLKIQPNVSSAGLFRHIGFRDDNQLVSYPVEYGLRKITLTIGAGTTGPLNIVETETITNYIEVYTEEGDALFSEDSDLISEEPDIMKWLPRGRGSFLDLHRKSQRLILDWFDRKGYRDDNEKKFTKFAFVDNSDVRMWSYYMVLRLFFMGAQNDVDDVFKNKASYYEKLEIASRERMILSLDTDGDGKSEAPLGFTISSGELRMR